MPPTPEAQLAYLGFQLISPGPLLRPYVREYWYCRSGTPVLAYHEEYMHPRGGFGIVFNFGDPLHLGATTVIEPVFLDATNTVSRKLGFLGQVELLGIRFHEGGAYPFLGVPLLELKNEIALLDALDRTTLLRLHACLNEAESLAARIHLLEEWWLGRLALGAERDGLIPASLKMLREKQGNLPIPQVAQEVGISQRQLERLYQKQVGMSPKQYAQLLRVERARLALKQDPLPSTTSLATEPGFYDQAHFIHEFSAVIGLTPYAYLKRKRQSR